MRLIDTSSTRIRRERTEHGNVIVHRDHFDGSKDATVHLKPIRVRLTTAEGAPLDREHLKAIGAFEEANRQHLIAKHSGNDQWAAHAYEQLQAAEQRLEETQ